MTGHLFVISAPSGTGKTTVIKRLLAFYPDIKVAVSYTTRPPRPNERDGKDYIFVDKGKFQKIIDSDGFLEWAEVHGNLYGTPKAEVQKRLDDGNDVLLDIDTKGAMEVKRQFPESVLIFLLPPSFEELEKRLRSRGLNTEEDLEVRINNAKKEYSRRHEYDYQVINDNLEETLDEIRDIVDYSRTI